MAGQAGARVQKALISGDFFARPQRLVPDLEAALMGAKAQLEQLRRVVEEFFANAPGELVGITPSEVARAVAQAGARLAWPGAGPGKCGRAVFGEPRPGRGPGAKSGLAAAALLLQAAGLRVPLRVRLRGLRRLPVHRDDHPGPRTGSGAGEHPVIRAPDGKFTAYPPARRLVSGLLLRGLLHQAPAGDRGVRGPGVLVNLDSTTCYDLGKGMAAYAGHFDNQTEMNTALIEKVARRMGRA